MTPSQRLTATGRARIVGAVGVVSPVRDANDPRSRERLSTSHFSEQQTLFTKQLESPSRVANIRVRRSNCGPALLQSPARAGYTECMRRIFEDAGREHQVPQSPTVDLYPQLPNISRKASASLVSSEVPRLKKSCSSSYGPDSLCLSMHLQLGLPPQGEAQRSLPHPSERSSGSWSDDSGYIITASRGRSHSFLAPPNEHIYSWLEGICDPEDVPVEETVAETLDSRISCAARSSSITEDPFLTESSYTNLINTASLLKAHPKEDVMISHQNCTTVRLAHDHVGNTCTQCPSTGQDAPQNFAFARRMNTDPAEVQAVEEAGMQLSPLSPNVCIERGPSRYHSNRTSRAPSSITTPCRDRYTEPISVPRMKENVLREELSTKGQKELIPRGSRLSIRSRQLQ